MFRTRITIVACTLVALVTGVPETAMSDGNELLGKCQSVIRFIDEGRYNNELPDTGYDYCLGYVDASVFLHAFYELATGPTAVCIPDGEFPSVQFVRIVVKFMLENPEHLHMDEGTVVIMALHDAYPCDDGTE